METLCDALEDALRRAPCLPTWDAPREYHKIAAGILANPLAFIDGLVKARILNRHETLPRYSSMGTYTTQGWVRGKPS